MYPNVCISPLILDCYIDAKKTDIVRGSKDYWISSAKDIGLCDGVDGEGIIYCSPTRTPLSIPNQELAYLVCG